MINNFAAGGVGATAGDIKTGGIKGIKANNIKAGEKSAAKSWRRTARRLFCGVLSAACVAISAADEKPIIATIAPLHSLVQGVMGDTGAPHLLVAPTQSLHQTRMSPAQARMLHNAAVIFYIDDKLETFMPAVKNSLSPAVRVVGVLQNPTLSLHRLTADNHDNDDMHVWLDVEKTRRIVQTIARELAALYPQHRRQYQTNARRLAAQLNHLDDMLNDMLTPVRNQKFVVMHDAYQHFTRRYHLSGGAAIRGRLADSSAQQLRRAHKATDDAVCLFGEPQIPVAQLQTIIDGRQIKIGLLDPLGANLSIGESLYFNMMRGLGRAFAECLSE